MGMAVAVEAVMVQAMTVEEEAEVKARGGREMEAVMVAAALVVVVMAATLAAATAAAATAPQSRERRWWAWSCFQCRHPVQS